MHLFENKQFTRFRDHDEGAVYENIEFRNCEFQSCSISATHSPALRSTIRNARLINSSEYGCFVFAAIIEDTLIDGLNTHGDTLQSWAAVFKHVTFRGKIGFLMTSPLVSPSTVPPEVQRAF